MISTREPSDPWRRLGVHIILVGVIALLVVGCVRILEPKQSNITYYLLDGQMGSVPTSPDSAGLTVGLREPGLASYLDAARIVTRYGAHTIDFSDFHRWGETLDRAINRVVARTLETQEGIHSAEVVPWSHGSAFDYVLQMHVLQFEGRTSRPPPPEDKSDYEGEHTGHSQMLVQWTILSSDGETVLSRGTTRHQETGWPIADYGALVSRLDTSLVVLAGEIGERIRAVDRRRRSRSRVTGETKP